MTFCGKLSILDKSTLELMKTILPKYTILNLTFYELAELQQLTFRHTNLFLIGPTSNRDLLSVIGSRLPYLTHLNFKHWGEKGHDISFDVKQFKHLTNLVYRSDDSCLLNLELLPTTLKKLEIECTSKHWSNSDTAIKHLKVPSGLKDLTLDIDEMLIVDTLPNTLTSLFIGFNSQVMINEKQYPKSLKTIMMCSDEGQVCDVDFLPIYLERLVLFSQFMGSIDHLPVTLTHIALGDTFDQPLDHLPSCLISLQIGNNSGKFNQPIDHLPESLEQLSIDGIFDQDISLLPKNLKVLELECEYNRPLPISMPNLHSLGLGGAYNSPLVNLPTTLKCLNLGDSFHQPIDLRSTTIERLRLSKMFYQKMIPGPLCSIKTRREEDIYYSYKPLKRVILSSTISGTGFKIFDRQDYFRLYDA